MAITARTNPLWTDNAELGAETLYKPDKKGLQPVLTLNEMGMPALWTVALGIAFDPALIPAHGDGQFGIDGIVRFGSGNAIQEFEIDWAEGTTFSLPMNRIEVIARYSDFALKSNTPPGLRLRVNLAPGGSLQGYATKSLKARVPAGPQGQLSGIPIPRFARRLSIQPGSGMSGAGQGVWSAKTLYQFMGTSGVSGDTGGFTGEQFLSSFAGNGYPIPPTARSLLIRNLASTDFSAQLIFHLAF